MTRQIYLFDSCAFRSMIDKRESKIPFEQIIKEAKEDKALIVITPYTLYELFKHIHTKEQFREESLKLCFVTEFFVKDVDHITGEAGFQQGWKYVFDYKLHTDDEEFYFNKFNELNKKVYDGLENKFIDYVIILSRLYFIFKGINEKKLIKSEYRAMLHYLDHTLSKASIPAIKSILGFIDPSMGKKSLSKDLVTVACIGVVASAMALLDIDKAGAKFDADIYKKLQMKYMEQLNPQISDFGETLFQLEKDTLERTNNKVTKKDAIQMATQFYGDSLYLSGLKKLLNNHYISKDILNSLIDLTNCYVASLLSGSIFVTEETKWIDLVMETENDNMAASKGFYTEYLGR